jgi:LacI family gluconate utilization system Gnt-I transcriptional repressor
MIDVARKAGVAAITVSRALSNPDAVSEKTLEKIQKAVRETGYVRNNIASGLASQRSNTVGYLVPTIPSPLLFSVVEGISEVLTPAGYNLLLGVSHHDPQREEALIRNFMSQRACGIFMLETNHPKKIRDLLRSSKIPVYEMGNLTRDPVDSVVSFSNFEAVRTLTSYLCGKYKRIAYVGRTARGNDRIADRLRGYMSAMKEHRREVDPRAVLEIPLEPGAAGQAISRLMNLYPRPNAVVFAAEPFSVDALIECYRRGWKVPQDIAIAGLDDPAAAAILPPGITSIEIPRREIGRRAAEALVARLQGQKVPKSVDIGFRLIERGSA